VEFFGQCNGISFFLLPTLEPLLDLSVCCASSLAISCDAFVDNKWFNGQWSLHQIPLSIAYRERFSVVLAAHVWVFVGLAGISCFMSIMK